MISQNLADYIEQNARRRGDRVALRDQDGEMRYAALCDGDDLVSLGADSFAVTERGRPFVRSIAATFDTYLSGGAGRHSVAV